MGITDYSATAASNTTINGVNIDEGCNPGGINNAIREIMADIATYNLPNLFSGANAAIALKANLASPVFTGTVTAPRVRLTTTTDVSLTSTGHAFQIGDTSGAHLKMDGNELQAQSTPTLPATFILNGGGGDVSIGTALSSVGVNGALNVSGGFTLNQTWQDVSGSRSAGTSYRNTTGKPIEVAIISFTSIATRLIQVSANNSTWVDVGYVQNNRVSSSSFGVPDDYYYRINFTPGVVIISWAELH